MSAKTRRIEIIKSHIAGLFASAITFIEKEQRSPLATTFLLRALQLFKEDKLAGVISSDEIGEYDKEERRSRLRNRIEALGPVEADLVYKQILEGLRPRATKMLLAEFPSLPDLLMATADRIHQNRFESSIPMLEKNLASFGLCFQMTDQQIAAVFPNTDFMSVNRNIGVVDLKNGYMLYVPGLSTDKMSYVCFGRSFSEALGVLVFEQRMRFIPDTLFMRLHGSHGNDVKDPYFREPGVKRIIGQRSDDYDFSRIEVTDVLQFRHRWRPSKPTADFEQELVFRKIPTPQW